MKVIPSYTKVITIGSAYTDNALVGPVVIQEKIDGSQFRFGKNEDGELIFGSKSAKLDRYGPDSMFKLGVDYIVSIEDRFVNIPNDTYFYAEYLQKPKHNVLKYDHVPQNHIVLFDVLSEGKWVERSELELAASKFGIDIIPELYRGDVTVDTIKSLLTNLSYLGTEIVEGVVIKNYQQTILLGGQVFPLFTKYVREAFKERHVTEWKIKKPKDSIDFYIQSFRSDARWQKAFQFLRDTGALENSPRDIPKLIERVNQDIEEEEGENIKKDLYKMAIKEILRVSTRGLPEWWKNKLLESIENPTEFQKEYLKTDEQTNNN